MNIRTKYFLVLVVAAAFVAAGCASEVVEAPAVEIVMDPDAPVTEAPPVYAVGSSWTYNTTANGVTVQGTSTIVEKRNIGGREVDVHASSPPNAEPGVPCHGANGSMFDAVTHNWMGCLKDGEILESISPHGGQFAWPLEVGKTWRAKFDWMDHVINPEWAGPLWEEWAVVAWEEVTVPAGTFMAYKIVRTKTSWETTNEDAHIVWYAPEWGGSVKGVFVRGVKDGYGPSETVWEMVAKDPRYPAGS